MKGSSMFRYRFRSCVLVVALTLGVAAPAAAQSQGDVTIDGAGFGHGVGMSQHGARSLATKGWSSTRILEHYYQGATVTRGATGNLVVGLTTTPRVDLRNRSTSASRLTVTFSDGSTLRVGPGESLRFEHVAGSTCRATVSGRQASGACTGARVTWPYDYAQPATHVDVPRAGLHDLTLARGFVAFQRPSNTAAHGQLHARLHIRSQEYLYGLAEVPSSWPAASLEAQAVAGRTYAQRLRGIGLRADCSCHLLTTVTHQHYTGWGKESEPTWGQRWVQAVDATAVDDSRGNVVTYGGNLISTFYSSSSAGATEDSRDIWGGDVPYLRSIPDPYSLDADAKNTASPWRVTPSYAGFAASLNLDSVASTRVIQTNRSGTPHLHEVRGTRNGRDVTIQVPATDAARKSCVPAASADCTGPTLRSRLGLRSHAVSRIAITQPAIPSWLEGDFDGDGRTDVASYQPVTGDWVVGRSDGARYTFSAWSNFPTRTGWIGHVTGDFTGNGRDEIASFHEATGTWWINRWNGTRFTMERWATVPSAAGHRQFLVGDFTGNGADDIATYQPSSGRWWVHRSSRSSFSSSVWATFSTRTGWQSHLVGDVTNDGRDDLLSYHPGSGNWWVSSSTGGAFQGRRWASMSPGAGWQSHVIGDFTGNGRADVASYFPGNGTWWVGASQGTATTGTLRFSRWARFSTREGWREHAVGDFDGDGRADVASYFPGNGTWWVSASSGGSFTTTRWGRLGTRDGWHPALTARPAGGNRDSLVTYHPANRSVWVHRSAGTSFQTTRWGLVR